MAYSCQLRYVTTPPRQPWQTTAPPCTRQLWRAHQQRRQALWRQRCNHRPTAAVFSPSQAATNLQEAATALDMALVRARTITALLSSWRLIWGITTALKGFSTPAVFTTSPLSRRYKPSAGRITSAAVVVSFGRRSTLVVYGHEQAAGAASEAAALRKAEELRDAGFLRGFGRARQVLCEPTNTSACHAHDGVRKPPSLPAGRPPGLQARQRALSCTFLLCLYPCI
jgi:hypothetical protein